MSDEQEQEAEGTDALSNEEFSNEAVVLSRTLVKFAEDIATGPGTAVLALVIATARGYHKWKFPHVTHDEAHAALMKVVTLEAEQVRDAYKKVEQEIEQEGDNDETSQS